MDVKNLLDTATTSIKIAEVSFKGVLETIQRLRDLKEKPQQLEDLLSSVNQSIERIAHLKLATQLPAPNPLHRLSTQRLEALKLCADDGEQAITGLRDLLEPVVNGKNNTKRIGYWVAVMSKKMERDIHQHLENINRCHDQIMLELQFSNIDLEAFQSENMERLLAIATETQSLIKTNMDSLNESLNELSINSTIATNQLQESVNLTVDKIEASSFAIEALAVDAELLISKTDEAEIRLNAAYQQGVEQVKQAIASESLANRNEISALRDALMPLILGQQMELSKIANKAINGGGLSDNDKNHLTKDLGHQLLSQQGNLRQACDYYTLTSQMDESNDNCDCDCGTQQSNITLRRFGFLSIRHESKPPSQGVTCRKHRSSLRRVVLAVQLVPFLERTVEFAFGGTFMGGGFHLDSPLRVFRTVRRTDAVMFQLFDGFIARSDGKMRSSKWQSHRLWDKVTRSGFQYFDLSPPVVHRELNNLYQELVLIDSSGRGSIHDVDESGHTLLHEIVYLIALISPVYSHVIKDIEKLLRLADRANIDVNAIAAMGQRPTGITELISGYNGQGPFALWTAGQGAQVVTRMFHKLLGDFSFLRHISTFGSFEYDGDSLGNPYNDTESEHSLSDDRKKMYNDYPTHIRSSLLASLHAERWLADYFYDDQLPLALLCRNLDTLKRLLLANVYISEEFLGRLPFQALELATGWPEGLKLLSELWNPNIDISRAIELASFECKWDSVEILCGFPAPLFKNIKEKCRFMVTVARDGFIALDVLADRRRSLARYAWEIFTPAERKLFDIKPGFPLDVNAYAVYTTLQERNIPVSPTLNPGPAGSMIGSLIQAFTNSDITYNEWNILVAFRVLFKEGFCNVNHAEAASINETPYTPLERIYHQGDFTKHDSWATISAVLLRYGASAQFQDICRLKNLLFGIAEVLGDYDESGFFKQRPSEAIGLLGRYAGRLFSPLETDGCECFCSSQGCLPLHYVLKGPILATVRGRCMRSQIIRIDSWLAITGSAARPLSIKTQLEESVRLEIFNRLDMRHTCCAAGSRLTAEEKDEIRAESEESLTYLELLLKAYRASRDHEQTTYSLDDEFFTVKLCYLRGCECLKNGIPGFGRDWPDYYLSVSMAESHRIIWLKQVAAILPIDRSMEGWLLRKLQEEFFLGTEALFLQQQGYQGLDFRSVIERHFEQDLNLPPLPEQSSEESAFAALDKRFVLELILKLATARRYEAVDKNMIMCIKMVMDDIEDEIKGESFIED